MTDKLKAQVSAFVDDELLDAESELLIRRLCSDGELRQVAARYTLMGDAIRGSLHEIRADLAGNIMQVIENEARESSEPVSRPRWPRAVGGGVVAAAVAAVAVLSLQPADGPIERPEEASIVVPETTPNQGQLRIDGVPSGIMQAGNQSQLDRYLLRHNQYATNTGRQQVLIYRSMGDASTATAKDAASDEDAREKDSKPATNDQP